MGKVRAKAKNMDLSNGELLDSTVDVDSTVGIGSNVDVDSTVDADSTVDVDSTINVDSELLTLYLPVLHLQVSMRDSNVAEDGAKELTDVADESADVAEDVAKVLVEKEEVNV